MALSKTFEDDPQELERDIIANRELIDGSKSTESHTIRSD
jgi:hypothetical protein